MTKRIILTGFVTMLVVIGAAVLFGSSPTEVTHAQTAAVVPSQFPPTGGILDGFSPLLAIGLVGLGIATLATSFYAAGKGVFSRPE